MNKMGSGNRQRRRRALILRDGETCAFCGSTNRLTIDHIVPRSYGGSDRLENLQLLCEPCNRARGCSGAGRALTLHWRGMPWATA